MPSCLPSLQANIHNVGIHYMSPGMVNTGLLMAGPHSAVTKMFINCLGEGRTEGEGGGGVALRQCLAGNVGLLVP